MCPFITLAPKLANCLSSFGAPGPQGDNLEQLRRQLLELVDAQGPEHLRRRRLAPQLVRLRQHARRLRRRQQGHALEGEPRGTVGLHQRRLQLRGGRHAETASGLRDAAADAGGGPACRSVIHFMLCTIYPRLCLGVNYL